MNLATDTVLLQLVNLDDAYFVWEARPSSWIKGDPIGQGDTPDKAKVDLLTKIQARVDYIAFINSHGQLHS